MEVNKRLNKRGFTLIELLAVIVILAILMTLAITSMSGVISNAKKDTYITTAQQYVNSVRFKFINGDYATMPGAGGCIAIKANTIELESGKNKSPFDKALDDSLSFIVIANNGTLTDPKYEYFVQMFDTDNNGFVLKEENALSKSDVLVKNNTTVQSYPTATGSTFTPGSLTLTGGTATSCKVEAVY